MKRKGSTEIVSTILLVVVIGALALAVSGTFSNQSRTSFETGMTEQANQMSTNFNDSIQIKEATPVTLNGSAK